MKSRCGSALLRYAALSMTMAAIAACNAKGQNESEKRAEATPMVKAADQTVTETAADVEKALNARMSTLEMASEALKKRLEEMGDAAQADAKAALANIKTLKAQAGDKLSALSEQTPKGASVESLMPLCAMPTLRHGSPLPECSSGMARAADGRWSA